MLKEVMPTGAGQHAQLSVLGFVGSDLPAVPRFGHSISALASSAPAAPSNVLAASISKALMLQTLYICNIRYLIAEIYLANDTISR